MPATVNTPPTIAQIPVKKWANDLVKQIRRQVKTKVGSQKVDQEF